MTKSNQLENNKAPATVRKKKHIQPNQTPTFDWRLFLALLERPVHDVGAITEKAQLQPVADFVTLWKKVVLDQWTSTASWAHIGRELSFRYVDARPQMAVKGWMTLRLS